MATVLDILHADHANLTRVLDFIEGQARLAAAGGQADLEALFEAADYLGDYPMHSHHPLENAVCEHIKRVRPAARAFAERLQHEHMEVESRLSQFEKLLSDAREGREVSRADFASAVDRFVKVERAHMASEEEELFPAAKAVLVAKDWALIHERAAPEKDPLFGATPKASLGRLRQLLLEPGAN